MTTFVIYALATFRLASLLVHENGPAHVFDRIRQRLGVYDEGEQTSIQELFSCVWCMSVWVAAALLVVKRCFFIHRILAASTVAIVIERYAGFE